MRVTVDEGGEEISAESDFTLILPHHLIYDMVIVPPNPQPPAQHILIQRGLQDRDDVQSFIFVGQSTDDLVGPGLGVVTSSYASVGTYSVKLTVGRMVAGVKVVDDIRKTVNVVITEEP